VRANSSSGKVVDLRCTHLLSTSFQVDKTLLCHSEKEITLAGRLESMGQRQNDDMKMMYMGSRY
jgi:hypothetical protein